MVQARRRRGYRAGDKSVAAKSGVTTWSRTVPFPHSACLTTFGYGRNRKRRVNLADMTRRLVLTTEAARHPFRRSLPPPAVVAKKRSDDQDLKLFALSFAAFFTCFYSFIF